MGKGDKPRPRLVSREEYDLRWKYYRGRMSFDVFEKKLKMIKRKGK